MPGSSIVAPSATVADPYPKFVAITPRWVGNIGESAASGVMSMYSSTGEWARTSDDGVLRVSFSFGGRTSSSGGNSFHSRVAGFAVTPGVVLGLAFGLAVNKSSFEGKALKAESLGAGF